MSLDPDEQYDGPVFGEGPVEVRPFRLVVHGPGDPAEGHQEQFMSHTEVDAGLVVALIKAPNADAQLAAAARLLLNTAVDTDGLSAVYVPPTIGEDDERVKAGDAAAGDVDVDHEAYDQRLEDVTQWSSQRRLARTFDDPSTYVKQSAIEEIARWLVSGGSARPTGPSRPSSSGPRRTGRGSGARLS